MRILVSLFLNALALVITANLVPGFHIDSLQTAVVAAIIIAIINTFIKPILLFLTAPLTLITLGLFIFVINAIVLYIASAFVHGLRIDGWLTAIVAAAILSVISTVLSMLVKDISGSK